MCTHLRTCASMPVFVCACVCQSISMYADVWDSFLLAALGLSCPSLVFDNLGCGVLPCVFLRVHPAWDFLIFLSGGVYFRSQTEQFPPLQYHLHHPSISLLLGFCLYSTLIYTHWVFVLFRWAFFRFLCPGSSSVFLCGGWAAD